MQNPSLACWADEMMDVSASCVSTKDENVITQIRPGSTV